MSDFDVVSWRTTDARPGEAVALWSPLVQPLLNQDAAAWNLPAGWTLRNPTRYGDQVYLCNWTVAVVIPADAEPGKYGIGWKDAQGNQHGQAVTVVEPPEPKKLTVASSASIKTIQAKIKSGGTACELSFSPGDYDLEAGPSLSIPAGASVTLDGGGYATLRRSGQSGEQVNRMISLDGAGSSLTLKGFRLVGEGPGDFVVHGYPVRFDVTDCTVENAQLVRAGAVENGSALFRRLTFKWGAGTGEFPASTWLDQCNFDGACAGGWPHAYFNPGVDRCLTTSCDWFRTGRGQVVQGQSRGCLTVGNQFAGICGQQTNGGEVILLEGAGEKAYNAWLWNFIRDCSGPALSMQGGGIHDNLFAGSLLGSRGESVFLAQYGSAPIAGNVFQNFECDGTIRLTGQVEGNTFAGLVFRDLPASSGNQPPFPANYVALRGDGWSPVNDQSTGAGNAWDVATVTSRGLVRRTVAKGKYQDGIDVVTSS